MFFFLILPIKVVYMADAKTTLAYFIGPSLIGFKIGPTQGIKFGLKIVLSKGLKKKGRQNKSGLLYHLPSTLT